MNNTGGINDEHLFDDGACVGVESKFTISYGESTFFDDEYWIGADGCKYDCDDDRYSLIDGYRNRFDDGW